MGRDLIEALKRIAVVIAFLYAGFAFFFMSLNIDDWGKLARVIFLCLTIFFSIGFNIITHPAMMENNEKVDDE